MGYYRRKADSYIRRAYRSDNSINLHKKKTFLASGCRDKTIKLWDVKEGKLIKTLEGHTSGVEALAYIKDSDYLASSSMDKTIIIWDMKDQKLLDENNLANEQEFL